MILKKILRKALNFLSKKNAIDNQLKRMKMLPRYTPGSFSFSNSIINFPDANSFSFMYKEIFIENIYKFNSSNPQPFILDCGANIGLSVIYFKSLFPEAFVIAFEPEKKIFNSLTANINALALSNVTLVNKAVWQDNSFLEFTSEGADSSRITSLGKIQKAKSTYQVEAVKLSPYIDKEVDFLKIDIEGAELQVIKEIEHKLFLVNKIFIEYHAPLVGHQQLQDILSILSNNGFRYYIDSAFRMRKSPFIDQDSFLSFTFFLNIFAEKVGNNTVIK